MVNFGFLAKFDAPAYISTVRNLAYKITYSNFDFNQF